MAVGAVLPACADDPSPPGSGGGGRLTVAAAASLTDTFEAIGADFEARHPGVKVTFTFGSSDALANQILEGAPVDVFAAASPATLERVTAADLAVGPGRPFAANRLAIVTAPGNPEAIDSLDDLADAGTVALCAEAAPCGAAAQDTLTAAGVRLPEDRVTRGENARATLGAVRDGDADAALVYVTDGRAAGAAVETIDVDDRLNTPTTYPITVLREAADPDLAQAFLDHVLAERSQRRLARAGFLPPPANGP